MKLLFMDIRDKVKCKNKAHCPPHYLPHKLPLGKKVTTEPCHYHEAKWRMAHHATFCKLLKCPNYKSMIKEYDNRG